jgi:hypothetical protein
MDDNLLRKKMESLDTLSGGIVYGKEEAWEKLHARMEAKPARKIKLQYAVAAAVLLLVSVSVGIYNYPGKEAPKEQVAANQQKPTLTEPLGTKEKEATKTTITEAPLQRSIISVEKHVALHKTINSEMPVVATNTTSGIVAEQKAEEPEGIAPPVAEVAKASMPVVHIDEVERKGAGRAALPATANPMQGIDIGRLQVVHINDLEKEDAYYHKMLEENKPVIGFHARFRPEPGNTPAQPEEYRQLHNPIKNLLNIQN